MYIMLDSMYVTMSISRGLYPNLDLQTANKLHYIALHFLQLLRVFSFQTYQPNQPHFPLACMNSLNFYKCPL